MPFKKYARLKNRQIFSVSRDVVDKPPVGFHITNFDIFSLFYSIFVHILDVALDINLAVTYYQSGRTISFILTLIFFLLPALLITLISLRMYVADKKVLRKSILHTVLLFLQLAPVLRYIDSLKYALLARRAEKMNNKDRQEKYYRLMLNEDADVALLRVFDCYLETAPQQILQISLLLQDKKEGETFYLVQQALSICSSFLSMAVCMAGYQRTIRFDRDNKNNISWMGSTFQFLWHLNITVSRILAISLIAYSYPMWTAISILTHWFAMSLWLCFIQNRAIFCEPSPYSTFLEICFAASMGLIYVFNYVSVREGPTRYYYLFYYLVCFIENLSAVIVWMLLRDSMSETWMLSFFVSLVLISFLLGILFMIVYYKYFHPRKYSEQSRDILNYLAPSGDSLHVQD